MLHVDINQSILQMVPLEKTKTVCAGIFLYIIFNATATSLALQNKTNLSISRDSARAAALDVLKKEDCFPSRAKRIKCCQRKLSNYPKQWFSGGHYLQNIFTELKLLNCPQILRRFCLGILYGRLSEYSRLVYQYHCDPKQFHHECTDTVARNRDLNKSLSWNIVMKDFDPSAFTMEQLKQPCMQLAAYDSSSGGYGFYHEMVVFDIPFCANMWCGFDSKTFEERGISHWDCMASR